ncbi:MAG: FliH/SctL family protein [Vulcanimicrobiota bacterium]
MYNNYDAGPVDENHYQKSMESFLKSKEIAENLLSLARKKGEIILKNAEKTAAEMKEQARKDGYEKGYNEGLEEGQSKGYEDSLERGDEIARRAEQAEEEISKSLDRLMENLEPRILELSKVVIKKILNKELEQDDEQILRTIREASRELTRRDIVQITVNRSEVEKIIKERENLISSSDLISDIEVLPKDDIEKGGCLVSSQAGIVDATIDSQLEVASDIISG